MIKIVVLQQCKNNGNGGGSGIDMVVVAWQWCSGTAKI